MKLVSYQPWSLLGRVGHDFDDLVRNSRIPSAGDNGRAAIAPPVDIYEQEQQYVLRVDVPGVDPQNIEVTAHDGILTIKAERASKPAAVQGYSSV